jgi:2-dehydro-3-deoxy-D-gluconate 5-dehydrogenase
MKLFDLTGRKALVTGAGSVQGLARGIAQGLQAAGAEVAILDRSESVFEVARHDGFHAVQADLGDRLALQRGFEDAVARLGTLDILVNSHGIQRRHQAEIFPLEDWDQVLEINLTSVFQLCQLAARVMIPRRYGKIINIASMLTFTGGITVPAYAASKGGIGQLTKALSNEWVPHGINVNAIAPGYMDTDMNTALKQDATRYQQIIDRIPAGRWGTPADIQGVAVFLASRASDYLCGTVIPVDGGWLAR